MRSRVGGVLALLIVLGFFGTLAACMYAIYERVTVDSQLKDVALVLLGALGTMTANVVGYYFGSSLGSAHKTDVLANK